MEHQASNLALDSVSRLNRRVRFSIITPSYNQSDNLKRCIASVADQGVEVEHLVHDAESTDETSQWLAGDHRVNAVIGKDEGMYDAINRGFQRASGDIVAWLNCDEQYLPDALPAVKEFFAAHPEIDMVFGDVVMVDESCEYLCHRRVEPPLLHHTWVCHLSTLSCGMFMRRRVVAGVEGMLDTSYRCGGDGEWMVRLLRRGIQTASLARFTSAFMVLKSNLGRSDAARDEWRRLRNTAPGWVRLLSPLWVAHHRLRRIAGGRYRQAPFSFAIYTPDSPDSRVLQRVRKPTFRCPG